MGSVKVLCFITYTSLLFLFVSSSSSTNKVGLSLYYETLCPYCRDFIVNDLAKALQTDLIDILDLKLIPWGNAMLQPNNTIVCQHGEEECYLNTIHSCVLNIWPDVMKHFKLIKCIEELSAENGAEASWKLCAFRLQFSTKPIKDCYNSGRGKQLLLLNAKMTEKLNPPHKYVPWVIVNNKPLLEDYGKFVAYVCKSYKGKPTPKACESNGSSISQKMSIQSNYCSANPAMELLA